MFKKILVPMLASLMILSTGTQAMASEETGEQRIYYTVVDNGIKKTLDYELQDYIYELCDQYDIEGYEKLLMAQFYCESSYRESIISGTNDYGIAQINKSNHKWLSKELGVTDFLNAKQSIECGVYMMADHLKRTGFRVNNALMLYKTGKLNKGNVSSSYTKRIDKIKRNMEEELWWNF